VWHCQTPKRNLISGGGTLSLSGWDHFEGEGALSKADDGTHAKGVPIVEVFMNALWAGGGTASSFPAKMH